MLRPFLVWHKIVPAAAPLPERPYSSRSLGVGWHLQGSSPVCARHPAQPAQRAQRPAQTGLAYGWGGLRSSLSPARVALQMRDISWTVSDKRCKGQQERDTRCLAIQLQNSNVSSPIPQPREKSLNLLVWIVCCESASACSLLYRYNLQICRFSHQGRKAKQSERIVIKP